MKTMSAELLNLDVQYASQAMNEIPVGYWIDKTISGCGLTTLALTDNKDSIILVPRVSLIENKLQQHNTGDIFGVMQGVSYEDLLDYVEDMRTANKPVKVVATYNSLGLGKFDALLNLDSNIRIYVDESQYLLEFAQNHVNILDKFHSILEENIHRVSFFSAKPPKVDYMPEYIRNMNKMVIKWSGTKLAQPFVCNTKHIFNATAKMLKGINEKGSFEYIKGSSFSKAIVFINSIQGIRRIIKLANLKKEDCAFIAGDIAENDRTLQSSAKRVKNPHNLPKFTFVTSTGLAGIDLYDEEAMTIVVSNVGTEWSMLDIELDVPQAISRQRVTTNPNYGKFIFVLSQSDMQNKIDSLEDKYNVLIKRLKGSVIPTMNRNLQDGLETTEMLSSDLQLSIVFKNGEYVLNESFLLAKKYMFKELFEQYKTGYTIRNFNEVAEMAYIEPPTQSTFAEHVAIIKNTIENRAELLEYLSDEVQSPEWRNIILFGYDNDVLTTHYSTAKELYQARQSFDAITDAVHSSFNIGEFYTRNDIKDILSAVYQNNNLERAGKATDINQYFEVKSRMVTIEGVRTKGFTILNKLK